VQILSNVKTEMCSKWPHDPLWMDLTWYTDLRKTLLKVITKAFTLAGFAASGSSDPVGRNLLIGMGSSLLKWNTNDWCERRAILNIVYAAVGRGGEVAKTSWNTMRWDVDEECVVLDWTDLKNGVQKDMSLHPDYSNMECCAFHSIACLLLMRGSITTLWVFPELEKLKSTCVAKVSAMIKDFRVDADNDPDNDPEFEFPPQGSKPSAVPGVGANHTSHGLRKGAVNAIVDDPLAGLLFGWVRGGWDFSGDCKMWGYLKHDMPTIVVGGRRLAGWPNCRRPSCSPRLVFVNDSNRELIDNLIQSLFGNTLPVFDDESKLKPFLRVLLATLLCHFEEMENIYGHTHNQVLKKLVQGANSFANIKPSQLREWGVQVKQDWRQRCIRLQGTLSNDIDIVKQLTESNVLLQQQFSELQEESRKSTKRMEDLLHELVASQDRSPCSTSSRKKTRRQEDESSPLPLHLDTDNGLGINVVSQVTTDCFQVMRQAAAVTTVHVCALKDVSLSSWFHQFWSMKLHCTHWSVDSKEDRRRCKHVIWFMLNVALFHDHILTALLSIHAQPDKNSSNHGTWNAVSTDFNTFIIESFISLINLCIIRT